MTEDINEAKDRMRNLVDEEAYKVALKQGADLGTLRYFVQAYEQAKLDKQDKLLREFEEAEKDDVLPDIEPPKVPEKKAESFAISTPHASVTTPNYANQSDFNQLIDCVNYLMNKGER